MTCQAAQTHIGDRAASDKPVRFAAGVLGRPGNLRLPAARMQLAQLLAGCCIALLPFEAQVIVQSVTAMGWPLPARR